jgi:hypothetical protein
MGHKMSVAESVSEFEFESVSKSVSESVSETVSESVFETKICGSVSLSDKISFWIHNTANATNPLMQLG